MTTSNNKIKHVIVLMMENRSFDHMLGFLYHGSDNKSPLGHPFEGLTGNETNPDSLGAAYKVFPIKNDNPYAYYMPKMDPGEGFMNTNYQLFGGLNPPYPKGIGSNQGFVRDFENKIGKKYFGDPPYHPKPASHSDADKSSKHYDHSKDYHNEDYHQWYKSHSPPKEGSKVVSKLANTEPGDIMGIFTPEMLPVLSGLAKAFAVCDHYYCSVPSETFPNRAFMHMATSQGHLYDSVKSYSAKSIFKHLTDNGQTWGIYGDGTHYTYTYTFCQDIADAPVPEGCEYGEFDVFQKALDNQTLPTYSFIEPEWDSTGNSQHPNYDVAAGEAYMLKIYNALRQSKYWEDTLLVINYDEHGGCYDHQPPPSGAASPRPINKASGADSPLVTNKATGFDFTRFGVRVPCVLISPWIEAGTVYRTKSSTPLDHTSILATLEKLFDMKPLTERDKAAPDVLDVLTLDEARKDDPMKAVVAPSADSSVSTHDNPSQIILALAESLTEKRNRETGEEHETPPLHTHEEAWDYIGHWYDHYYR